jgi:hypothetical protein
MKEEMMRMTVQEVLTQRNELIGKKVCVDAKPVERWYRVSLVSSDAPRDPSSQASGILVKLPGLACALTRAVVGPVGAIHNITVTGVLRDAPVEPFPLMIDQVERVRVITRDGQVTDVGLENLTELSPAEEEGHRSGLSQEDGDAVVQERLRRRRAW